METATLPPSFKPTYDLLKLTFGIVPMVAGIDKFTDILTHWENYIHPSILSMLPFSPHVLMMIVGIIEIVAGLIVLAKPAIGGFIVAAWLTLIAVSLLARGNFLDVAVRDLVMAISAFSLAKMARSMEVK